MSAARRRWLWPLLALGVFALWQSAGPPAARPVAAFGGVFWQPDCPSAARLSDYRPLGAQFVVWQWTQLDEEDYSGQGPSQCRLDWAEAQRRSGGLPVVLGLKSLSRPTPEQLPQLARESAALAERLKLLPLSPAPLGYYAPIELNPTWSAEPVRAYLDALPRPLWVSAYAVPGQLGPDFVAWLRRALPADAHLMLQDGVGAHGFAPADIAAVVRALQGTLGAERVSVVVEVFRPFSPGVFRSAWPWELDRQLGAYRGFQTVAFDGGHYMSRAWQQFFRLYHRLRLLTPLAGPLRAVTPPPTGGPA